MSPALSIQQIPALSRVYHLVWQDSMESSGSSTDGIESQQPQAFLTPAPANESLQILSGFFTYQQVSITDC